jgi:hypothetical protein
MQLFSLWRRASTRNVTAKSGHAAYKTHQVYERDDFSGTARKCEGSARQQMTNVT